MMVIGVGPAGVGVELRHHWRNAQAHQGQQAHNSKRCHGDCVSISTGFCASCIDGLPGLATENKKFRLALLQRNINGCYDVCMHTEARPLQQ